MRYANRLVESLARLNRATTASFTVNAHYCSNQELAEFGRSSAFSHRTPIALKFDASPMAICPSPRPDGRTLAVATIEDVIGYAKTAQERTQEYANNTQLEKLGPSPEFVCMTRVMLHPGKDLKRVGLSTFNDILNAVAPPISEHEVIQVWLSHDMQGLEGVESLVYTALARVCPHVVCP